MRGRVVMQGGSVRGRVVMQGGSVRGRVVMQGGSVRGRVVMQGGSEGAGGHARRLCEKVVRCGCDGTA